MVSGEWWVLLALAPLLAERDGALGVEWLYTAVTECHQALGSFVMANSAYFEPLVEMLVC